MEPLQRNNSFEGIAGGRHGVPSSIIANVILLILLRFEDDSDARPKRSQD